MKAWKRRDDPLGILLIVDAGEAEADRHARMVSGRKSGVMQSVADDRARGRDRRSEIDMDVRRGAERLRERAALAVPDPHATPRRAAVDADEPQRRFGHLAAPPFWRTEKTAACIRGLSLSA